MHEIDDYSRLDVRDLHAILVRHLGDRQRYDLHSRFGVRPERYLIDDVLGGAFAKAANDGVPNPVNVVGPPYVCKTHLAGENESREEANNSGDEEKDTLH